MISHRNSTTKQGLPGTGDLVYFIKTAIKLLLRRIKTREMVMQMCFSVNTLVHVQSFGGVPLYYKQQHKVKRSIY